LPPVSYLEVGTDLPRSAAPSGATIRRVSNVVLVITSTSDNQIPRASAPEAGV
jgi:hypothetical protein